MVWHDISGVTSSSGVTSFRTCHWKVRGVDLGALKMEFLTRCPSFAVKYGNEKCEEGDRCWEGMTCQEGFCRCEKGRMTSDKMFCLDHNERLFYK